jgi:large subunit ribosomal protein L18e
MKSKSKIEKQLQKKRNPELVETIIAAKKKDSWLEVARVLSTSRRKRINLNLSEINKNSSDGEIIVVPGKVLSLGELEKKVKVVALNFSDRAKEKILSAKGQVSTIIKEIKENPSAKGVKVLLK